MARVVFKRNGMVEVVSRNGFGTVEVGSWSAPDMSGPGWANPRYWKFDSHSGTVTLARTRAQLADAARAEGFREGVQL